MLQSFIFPSEIFHEMDEADYHDCRQLTSSACYTSTKAVIKQMCKVKEIIDAGFVLGICVAVANMNSMPNTNVLEPSLHKPRILLPLPRAQSTLPQELALTGTRIPDAYLDMGICGQVYHPLTHIHPDCTQTLPSEDVGNQGSKNKIHTIYCGGDY